MARIEQDVLAKAQKEAEANYFAFELLMPEDDVRRRAKGLDIADMNAIIKLSKRYGVEPAMMAMRLGQLHFEVPRL